ncbi:FecR domain-containing protein [Marivibrio halodurans]|uniref:FecR domain-containing protein n=1 Tax=Marivibrio halodurans TaxID=2039722 RepID=A0A8J7V526_9PROT|nr:FecR domain-containing protein [Marivibrio halodurans]MBP5858364.1 FecR domain-containing protein [Marivibrio halodurans]
MNETAGPFPNDDAIDEATAWFHRLREAADDVEVSAGFQRWIERDEANAEAWRLVSRAWRLSGDAAEASVRPRTAGDGLDGAGPSADRGWDDTAGVGMPAARHGWRRGNGRARGHSRRRAAPRRRTVIRAVAAGIACLAVVLAAPSMMRDILSDVSTAVGETRTVALSDGSNVHLSADSAIALDMGESERSVRLVEGEAFFDVESDPDRPFLVRAEDLTVRVTGTAFDVRVTARRFVVAVAEGSVDVSRDAAAPTRLRPGQRLSIDRTTGHSSVTSIDVANVAAWRSGQLMVEDAPLLDVVDVLRRYHDGMILVASTEAEARHVTGVFDLTRPERALRTLVAPYGAGVRAVSDHFLLMTDF